MGANGFGNMVFTQEGLNLLAKAQAGTPLKITRIAVGDGYLNDQDPTQFTQLINQILSLDIATMVTSGPGSATIGAVLSNANLSAGFYWREIGIFAQDPQLGEILYGYDNSSGHEIYVPPASANSFTAPVNVGVYVSNSASVTAQIDPTLVYATKQDLTTLEPLLGFTPANKAGDTLTGPLTLASDPTQALHAATKQYVDATAQGLSIKQSVRVATIGNIALSGTQTIDGIALNAGDRVLVKDQTDKTANGIYVIAAGAWTRSSDTSTAAELTGMFVFVEQGTVNAASGWVLPINSIVLGTTALTYTQFSGAGEIVPGPGISKTGNALNVTPATAAAIGGVIVGNNLSVDGAGKVSANVGIGANTFSGNQAAPAFVSTAVQGTAPIQVISTTMVNNLNADLLDGQHGSYYLALANQTGVVSDTQHGSRGGGGLHAVATQATAGFLSSTDKAKLDGIAPWATNTPLSSGIPAAEAIGTAASAGVSSSASKSDHKHAMPSAADVLAALKTVDGAGSGLDADTVDGKTPGTGANNILLLDSSGRSNPSGGFVKPGRLTSFVWSGTIDIDSDVFITHNLGYAPMIAISGTVGNLQLTYVFDPNGYTAGTTVRIYNYGGNAFTGKVYLW